ncbi:MAG: hypothetical protein N4A44_02875 [Alphaproteobacteria bacterium]|jgi:hypothetical protein|nr:hypothetical protein [Alphaproteobacteria bacterium]
MESFYELISVVKYFTTFLENGDVYATKRWFNDFLSPIRIGGHTYKVLFTSDDNPTISISEKYTLGFAIKRGHKVICDSVRSCAFAIAAGSTVESSVNSYEEFTPSTVEENDKDKEKFNHPTAVAVAEESEVKVWPHIEGVFIGSIANGVKARVYTERSISESYCVGAIAEADGHKTFANSYEGGTAISKSSLAISRAYTGNSIAIAEDIDTIAEAHSEGALALSKVDGALLRAYCKGSKIKGSKRAAVEIYAEDVLIEGVEKEYIFDLSGKNNTCNKKKYSDVSKRFREIGSNSLYLVSYFKSLSV